MGNRILQACCWLAVTAFLPFPALAQSPIHAVLISHRVTNTGEATARAVKAICILPASNHYQEVLDLQFDPPPIHTQEDAEKQKVITVDLGDIPAGESRAVRVMAWARLKPIYVDLLVPPRRAPTTLPADVAAGELTDGWLLQLDKVRPKAEKAAGTAGRDLDRARAAFEYMTRTCVYDIDDEFDPADKILEGTPASCSELAYTYVAMCRSLGIPARIVSAYVNREGTAPSTDWRTHRWVEFHAREYGWVVADPTNRINDSSKTYFGRQDAKYLTVIDDGVPLADGTPDPAWQVFIAGSDAREQVALHPAGSQPGGRVPRARLEPARSAVWRVSVNRTRESKLFHDACAALRSDDVQGRRAAVTAWTRQREVMTYGYLTEALFDVDKPVRLLAIGALARSNDESLLIPLALMASQEKDKELKDALLATARKLLNVPSETQRALAVAELAKSRTPEALALLGDIWTDASREVRKAVALNFFKFGKKPEVDEAYRTLSNDSDDFIRVISALRWSRLDSPEADALLVGLLESDVEWDRSKALQELMKRTGDRFGFDATRSPKLNEDAIAKWRAWSDSRAASVSGSQSR